jgi:flagellar M-ring protein FliF
VSKAVDERLKKILSQITNFWKSLSKNRKLWIVGGFFAIALLLTIVLLVFNTTQYSLLYSGIDDTESGQIITQLKSMGVAYKVQNDDIYVDKNLADETRMQLAENGFPQSDLTYSTYTSGSNWAQTDSDKQLMALYQLQDRLQDTIKTIPGVKSAEVTIGQTDNTDYVLTSDNVPVTASVKLNLTPGADLTSKQVTGIVLIVSHAYPNLSQDNVTVLDSDGTPLTTDDSNSDSDVTTQQLKLQTQVENQIKSKILSVLKPVYGDDNVQVAAGVVLDFSQKTTDTTSYSGANSGAGVVTSENKGYTINGDSGTVSGVVGVNGGTPTYPDSSVTGNGTTVQSSDQTSYLVNTVNEQIKSQGASVSKLTVAVLLNNKDQSVATTNIQNVKETVAYAVGIDPNNVSIQLTRFTSNSAPQTVATPKTDMFLYYLVGGTAAFALLLIVFLIIFLRRGNKKNPKRRSQTEEQQETVAVPGGVAGGYTPRAAYAAPGARSSVPIRSIEDTIATSEGNAIKKQIEDFTDKKPELVAQLLKNWLKD